LLFNFFKDLLTETSLKGHLMMIKHLDSSGDCQGHAEEVGGGEIGDCQADVRH